MTYEEAVAYIAALAPRGWRLGLDRMQELLRLASLDDAVGKTPGPAFIHVAGTNGKGSVTAFLQSLLIEQGYNTGAFFSPYVYDPRERVQLGRQMISKEDLARLTAALKGPAESLSFTQFGGATEFEFKTALGFQYWKEKGCHWVALEVGLGGRLDATNVVTPRASVIVSIGLDHTSILGADISAIAIEKAGIIKPGVPVIVGEMPTTAKRVIESAAREHSAPVWRFGHEIQLVKQSKGYSVFTPAQAYSNLMPGLVGEKQAHNMALAIAALDAADAVREPECIRAGASRAAIPGRFERRKVCGTEIVLDGAHNPDAAIVLRDNMERFFPGREAILVTGMVAGHDPAHFFERLDGVAKSSFVVPIDFHRAISAEELGDIVRRFVPDAVVQESVGAGLEQAIALANQEAVVLITGSFYLVGQAGKELDRIAAETCGSKHRDP